MLINAEEYMYIVQYVYTHLYICIDKYITYMNVPLSLVKVEYKLGCTCGWFNQTISISLGYSYV